MLARWNKGRNERKVTKAVSLAALRMSCAGVIFCRHYADADQVFRCRSNFSSMVSANWHLVCSRVMLVILTCTRFGPCERLRCTNPQMHLCHPCLVYHEVDARPIARCFTTSSQAKHERPSYPRLTAHRTPPEKHYPGYHKNVAYARGGRDARRRGSDPERLEGGRLRRGHLRAVPAAEQAAHADAGVHHARGVRGVAEGRRGEATSAHFARVCIRGLNGSLDSRLATAIIFSFRFVFDL